MVEMKTFNYSRIYLRDELAGQRNRIFLILDELFNYFLLSLSVTVLHSLLIGY